MFSYKDYYRKMRDFEGSKLFKAKYDKLMDILEGRCRDYPDLKKRRVKSFILQLELDVNSSQVRRLIMHARRLCMPIGSDENGYYFCKSQEELTATIKHMTERKNSMLFTLTKLNNAFSPEMTLYSYNKERV